MENIQEFLFQTCPDIFGCDTPASFDHLGGLFCRVFVGYIASGGLVVGIRFGDPNEENLDDWSLENMQ
jgi:hypothetical protein